MNLGSLAQEVRLASGKYAQLVAASAPALSEFQRQRLKAIFSSEQRKTPDGPAPRRIAVCSANPRGDSNSSTVQQKSAPRR